MAVIAIFCDGTWNRFDSQARTHVARLADACAVHADQKILYLDGVGTGVGMLSRLDRWLDRVGGGLFGWGLERRIKAAYLELCRSYRPGDKIMVFGFSRGAYTARSLVGMIRKCGILRDPSPQNLRRAFRLYRRRGAANGPDAPHIRKARRELSPDFATSATDVLDRAESSALVRIAYLGVWDTVGALGIPESVFGPLASFWNRRYAFHDTRLTHLVEHARHAVALDERRVLFEPSLWGNLDTSEQGVGLNGADSSINRPYQQLWFAGSHGIVGGSVAPKTLSAASLEWIWSGARQAGLQLRSDRDIPEVVVNTAAPAPDLYAAKGLYRLFPQYLKWREGPAGPKQLHATVRMRAALVSSYRPASLKRALPGLFEPK